MTANYIRDTNRFALGAPPKWWLTMLWDFDNQLVVIPSRQFPVYILARKARRNPLLDEHAELNPDRDVRMLASRQLVYVSVLQGTGLDRSAAFCTWHTGIFNELRRRDITRNGGHAQCVKRIEEFEEDDRRQALDKVRDEEAYRDKEAYKHLKRRVGERISNTGLPRAAAPAHSGSTVGLGR